MLARSRLRFSFRLTKRRPANTRRCSWCREAAACSARSRSRSGGFGTLAGMVFSSLADIENVIRSSCPLETCDPVDAPLWTAEAPARGQCAATALVVQDLLGGRATDVGGLACRRLSSG